jgi:oligopeptide transport system ATP-binding protein
MSLIECRNLNVRFNTDGGEVHAVNNLSFTLDEGECLGIVGESGSGKSQTFLATMGLLADNGFATGSVMYRGQEILNASRTELDAIRGYKIAMIFQDALSSLTPTMRIGDQLAESLIRHLHVKPRAARNKAVEMLEIVGIPDPKNRCRAYPFELSGGMRQRVMIAMAVICKPELLIADEPTTALDVTVQAQILRLLDGMKRHTRTSIVLITHDLAVVAGICDRVIIMYGGRAVESGLTRDIFRRPQHPYTEGLLRSVPTLNDDPAAELPTIPGYPPDLENLPDGCVFADRCTHVMERCRHELPELRTAFAQHRCACHLGTRS